MKTVIGVVLCVMLVGQVVAKEIPLPIFMKGATDEGKLAMLELLSRGDLPPKERRALVDELVAGQPAQVQKAYKQYNDLLDQHAQKYGISLEAELEKARQDYLAKHPDAA
ncbi:unnamed protein product [Bursaphelenchus okinawaensis]|uniref:Uncharacterized protein n=1 Tax=Bursaphelenchus okinawaensis TaxID=465554 RepID=A0A811KAU3_9BILA|nr:unnamed protein product [Bursaphelenchus okinawaensis]CAG9098013.1 unnamed protein product [Bursaphelenchus okinawaensis]